LLLAIGFSLVNSRKSFCSHKYSLDCQRKQNHHVLYLGLLTIDGGMVAEYCSGLLKLQKTTKLGCQHSLSECPTPCLCGTQSAEDSRIEKETLHYCFRLDPHRVQSFCSCPSHPRLLFSSRSPNNSEHERRAAVLAIVTTLTVLIAPACAGYFELDMFA
jgi:hypothetical protein